MNPATIIQLVLAGIGLAEQVAPVFIHNPNSQKLETIIFTDLNAVLSIFQQKAAPPAPATQLAQAHTQPLVNPTGPAVFPTK